MSRAWKHRWINDEVDLVKKDLLGLDWVSRHKKIEELPSTWQHHVLLEMHSDEAVGGNNGPSFPTHRIIPLHDYVHPRIRVVNGKMKLVQPCHLVKKRQKATVTTPPGQVRLCKVWGRCNCHCHSRE